MDFLILIAIALAVAYHYGAFGQRRTWSSAAKGRIMLRALTVGAIGFSAGFFGPMFLTPDANQGPLLGIFITGPLGVVVGLIWGLWRDRGEVPARDDG